MRASRTWPQRLIAAAASVALVGAGLVTLGHHVETRHEICAEHGELIHVSADGTWVAEVIPDAISDDPSDLDHGEHCAVVWSSPPVTAIAGPTAIAGVADQAAAPLPALSPNPAARALYRLAPKTSPPA